jgi:D-alanyl-lipoteichoic acid acyltransferase DltB (MBOAT superfamily)
MLFVEPVFLFVFLPLVLLAERLTRNTGHMTRSTLLVASGAIFYGAWSWKYLCLLFLAILCNFGISRLINRDVVKGNIPQAKILLAVAVIGNLSLLALFKYLDFFLSSVGVESSLNLILPLAISFYTFQQVAYVVDVYRQEVKPPAIMTYFSFVLFFPQLIAGPIVNYKDVKRDLCRFQQSRSLNRYDLALPYLIIGLGKKLLIADPLGGFLAQQQLVMSIGESTPLLSILTILAYGLQLYFDFSAYGDLALALGFALGIRLPINFDAPYKSRNIAEFWRRWHITLGRFLRDYLYIPLGGSRGTLNRTMLNLMIVMLLGGLWHGAAWGYVLWGALHGGALVLHQSLIQFRNYLGRRNGTIASKPDWVVQLNNGFSILFTASFVLLAWVPFYTESISDALMLWSSAFSYSGEMIENANTLYERYGIEVGMLLVNITIGLALVFFTPTSHELVNFCVRRWQKLEGGTIHNVLAHPLMLFVYTPIIMIVGKSLLVGPVAAFLYFQF